MVPAACERGTCVELQWRTASDACKKGLTSILGSVSGASDFHTGFRNRFPRLPSFAVSPCSAAASDLVGTDGQQPIGGIDGFRRAAPAAAQQGRAL